jgi:hypothetical protein
MIRNYKHIPNIVWPIYRIEDDDWHVSDGLVLYKGGILDDRNMPGDSLGLRRLQTPHRNLYPLKLGKYTIPELLKFKYYIDSAGKCFIYEKTVVMPLKYHLIKKVEKKETVSIAWLADIGFPFELRNPPLERAKYARVLYLHNTPWLIYDFTELKGKDTTRKI